MARPFLRLKADPRHSARVGVVGVDGVTLMTTENTVEAARERPVAFGESSDTTSGRPRKRQSRR